MKNNRFNFTLLLSIALLLLSCGNSINVASYIKTLNKFNGVSYVQVFPKLNFTQPLALVQEPGNNDRWYVVEKDGRIFYFANKNNAHEKKLFIDISDSRVDARFEGGLLGMAFHPNYSENGFVFLSYTSGDNPGDDDATNFRSHISRFSVNKTGTKLNPDSEQILLTIDQPWDNHNGGNILFGPDSYLYAGYGDGGSWADPNDNGQNINTLLATMLRIDINVSEDEFKKGIYYKIPAKNPFSKSKGCATGNGCPEIFAWGLRNPWRWSFDRETKSLWLGDVGQNAHEEIDIIKRGGNYGWRCREGKHPYKLDGCNSGINFEEPVLDYGTMYAKNTTEGRKGASVTGGYVYRGSAIPKLQAHYVFADFVHGLLFAINTDKISPRPILISDTDFAIASFAEDQKGELYFLSLYGPAGIFKIVGN
jgi:glucose/arabinose dehydrogenase